MTTPIRRRYDRELYVRRREAGQCVRCEGVPDAGFHRCGPCRRRGALRMRDYRRRHGVVATGAVREARTVIVDLQISRAVPSGYDVRIIALDPETGQSARIEHRGIPGRLLEAVLAPYVLADYAARALQFAAQEGGSRRIISEDGAA